jgi:hypothetical protein
MKLDRNMIRTFSKTVEEIQTLQKMVTDWSYRLHASSAKKNKKNAMSPNPGNCVLKSEPKPCPSTSSLTNIVPVKLLFFHTSQLRCLYANSEKFSGKTGKLSLGASDFSLLHIIQTG